jgi:DNA-directed RNA polymerase specialized sigma subunit
MRSRAKVLTIKAVKTFDPMSGTRLNSWIVTNLQPLSRYSVKQRDVHISEDKARLAAQLNTVANQLKDDLGRDPTDEELADETGMSVKRIRDARKAAVATVTSGSFDELAGDDDSSSIPGVFEPSKVPFAQEAVYHDLSPEDRFIFDSVLGTHGAKRLSGKDVALKLGITPAAVSLRAKKLAEQIAYIVNNG